MEFGEILTKAWKIIWKFKILWVFGILSSCGHGGGGAVGEVIQASNFQVTKWTCHLE